MEEKVIKLEDSKYILQSIEKILYLFIKRLFDIFVSLIGCLFILPLSVIIKVCYMLQKDYNPILFTQERIGKDGNTFKLYKFRSMVPNADEVLNELLKNDSKARKEWKKYQKLSNDPRITKIGRIIRKLSLDELPQLINVIKGDMSMIGPRPLVIGELDQHNGNHDIYESVKPGITGWWACNGRSDIEDYDKRLELEYYYIKCKGIKMDIKCIFKTIIVVLNSKGAK